MPCLIVALALVAPRVGIALLWLFTQYFHGVFDSKLWPALGFVFMPVTLLWYSFVIKFLGSQWGILAWIGLAIAVLVDVGALGSSRESYKSRLA